MNRSRVSTIALGLVSIAIASYGLWAHGYASGESALARFRFNKEDNGRLDKEDGRLDKGGDLAKESDLVKDSDLAKEDTLGGGLLD